jgi:hypothetical protein
MHTEAQNNRNWLAFIYLLIGVIVAQPVNAHSQNDEDWANWAHYLDRYPDYRKHQEPQDISTNGCKWGAWVTFPNKIDAIAAKVGDWKDPTVLFNSLDFVAIYKHPDDYYEHCLAYLNDDKHPEQKKKIVIYALENMYHYLSFAKSCYKLYQQQKLSEDLFQTVLGFELLHIHPLVAPDKDESRKKRTHLFLQQVHAELGSHTLIGQYIEAIVSGKLAQAWARKGPSPHLHYKDPLPIIEIIREAIKELSAYERNWFQPQEIAYSPPYFLMLIEHINSYVFLGNPDNNQVLKFLANAHASNGEKRLLIFVMYQLGHYPNDQLNSKQIVNAYRELLTKAYLAYREGNLSLALLEDLLHSALPFSSYYPRYPFCVLQHKSFMIDEWIDAFLALPTVPCGWKEMARKFKKGTLLTSEDTKYLRGYQRFMQTHFTLYENIPQKTN